MAIISPLTDQTRFGSKALFAVCPGLVNKKGDNKEIKMWQDRGVEIILGLLVLWAVAAIVIGIYLFTKL